MTTGARREEAAVVGVDSNVISLANDCICCTIRDDLAATVIETISRPERPEYILLEASGVAEPSGIAMTFNDPGLRDRIRLDSILCVVDAEQVFAAPELIELKLFQIACADMIILNKVDLVDTAYIGKIREWLDGRFHRYQLIATSHAEVPLPVLLSVGRYDPARFEADPDRHRHHDRDHSNTFSTWAWETDRSVSLQALREAAARLPANIYRAKGVIRSAEAPARRAVLQVVGRRVDIALGEEWGERPRRTPIVAIGAAGTIDGDGLRASFARCLCNPDLPPAVGGAPSGRPSSNVPIGRP